MPRDKHKNLLFLILLLICACVSPPPPAPEAYYYLDTEMTYLRDAPGYEANVVGQLYRGDQLIRLESDNPSWRRVRSGRTGQTGWVPEELLSPTPVPVTYYLVTNTVQLRECPNPYCPAMQLLSRGDQVQKIEQNNQGWWRVLVTASRNIGWLPAGLLADRLEPPPAKAPEPQYYYVSVRALKLRQQPLDDASVIKNLSLNDQLQKLEQNPLGWYKVREPVTGAVGWVRGRYLRGLPLTSPPPKKPGRQKPVPVKPTPQETPPEPEVL